MGTQILIVEDVQDLRDLLKEVFQLGGFESVTASNGVEALEMLAKMEPPSMILLDLMMPHMNGWEFRRQQILDARLANIPVVLISAGGNVDDQAYNIGAADYLRKPFDPIQLIQMAERYCGAPKGPQGLSGKH